MKAYPICTFTFWVAGKCNGPLVNMDKMIKLLLLFKIGFVLSLSLQADEIITQDGSRLTGKLILLQDGNLTFETDFAGKIIIPTSKINSFFSDNEISIRLDDNRTFESKIIKSEQSKITLEENQLTTSLNNIRHLWSDQGEDPFIMEAKRKKRRKW